MDSDRFKKIEEIYHAALDVSPEEQASFLEKACGADRDLKKEVEDLLKLDDSADNFIDNRPDELAAELLSGQAETYSFLNKKIGRYEIQSILGEGGMGTVYLAQDTRLRRLVALKVLPPEMVKNEDRVKRFMHEARSASALNHPYILTVYEIDEFLINNSENIHYISMEYVEGVTLQEIIYSRETSSKNLIKYLAQVATGLAKAHAAGIIHRDLKPENIMISNDGYAKILDFGLAKLTDKESELHKLQEHRSRPGVILGTLGYMSPEQARGKKDIDERSDIFSFGCILYEAFAKRKAFEGETTIDALHQIIHAQPTPLTDLVPHLPFKLKDLLEKCLQKKPAKRTLDIKTIASVLRKSSTEDLEKIEKVKSFNEQRTVNLNKGTTQPTISRRFSEERRQVTVMFVDFSAFAEMLEELDPEESAKILRGLQAFLDDLIIIAGGRIGERLNDTFIAIWGTEAIKESDPEKTVGTALELQTGVREYFQEKTSHEIGFSEDERKEFANTHFLKVGISTGTILVGNSSDKGELVTTGLAVNVAKRILAKALIGEIFVSGDTYRHIRGVFDVEEITQKADLSLKNKKTKTRIYSIKGVKPRAFRLESRGVEGIETQMIGRAGELAKMLDALEAISEDRELQVITIVGEAGLGKSRLLFEFQDQIELLTEKYCVFKARALETMRGLPYSLIRDLFLFRFEIQESDSQNIAREKFVDGVLEMIPDNSEKFVDGVEGEMKAHFIGHLIGLDFSSSVHIRGILEDEKQIQERANLYVAQFFSLISQKLPVVIYLDDLHWADDESLNFLNFIIENCAEEAILIAEFTRPILYERRPHWGEGQENRIRLNLHPLTKRQSRKLTKDILQKTEKVPKIFQDLLVSNTEGNPFYVEELIKMFIEQRVIDATGEKWSFDKDRFGEITIPPTLTGVLQSRLDKLSEWEKRILQRASVIGREFWDSSLRGFEEQINVPTILESLRNKELLFRKENSVFEDETEYIFKHALLRDVTYETVLLEDRRRWHLETAEWLIETSGERENEYLAVIAGHFENAKEIEKAGLWYGRAGEQAEKSHALKIAETYFEKALGFWKEVSGTEGKNILTQKHYLEWKFGLAKMFFEQAKFEKAIAHFNEMLEVSKRLNDKFGQAYANWGLSFAQFDFGETRNSLKSAKEAVRLAGSPDLVSNHETKLLLARGFYRQGRALISLGEFDEAEGCAENLLEFSKELGTQGLVIKANALHLLAASSMLLGDLKKAREFEKREVEISRQIGDKRTAGNGLNSLGFQSYMQGAGRGALRFYEEALEIAREIGNKTGEIMVKSNIGGARVYLGEYEKAEKELTDLITEVGDKGHFLIPETYRFLTESLIGQKEFDKALETARKSLLLAKESESDEMTGEAWRVLGIISSCKNESVLIEGQHFNASDCFKKGLEIFKASEMEANYAQAMHNFARHQFQEGDTQKAEDLLRTEKEISERLDINTEAKSIYFRAG